ncbi:MAG: hypothetical protein QOE70_2788 [Chthoniobacter sp.]|nr:hypothetical protein [Chthoniobacter sp.]
MIAALTASAAHGMAAEAFQKTLISARDGVRIDALEISGRDVTPDSPGWSIRKLTLHGGKQEGVDVIIVNNGKLEFTVVPTRGMGVLSVTSGDVRLGWDSPVKEVVHPRHIDLQSRGGLGWLEGFNEWLARCGLESNGHPGTDKFINNVGEVATMDLTLHGKIANIPASEVDVFVDAAPPHRLRVRGRIDERMFYGPKLELQTEISTEPGSSSFRIADEITNQGAQTQEFELMYHINFGPPLLGEGATFLAPVARVTPFNEHAAREVAHYAEYSAPELGFVEEVYCIDPVADKDGLTLIALRNKAGDRALSMKFLVDDLPFVTLWKNTNAEAEGYVTGLEPGTNFPNNRRVERKFGRVPKLAAGESHSATIDFTIHTSAEETKLLAEQIAQVQGEVKPVLLDTPENKD